MENYTRPPVTVVSIILAMGHGGPRKDAAHVTRDEVWMATAGEKLGHRRFAQVQVMVHRGGIRWNIVIDRPFITSILYIYIYFTGEMDRGNFVIYTFSF